MSCDMSHRYNLGEMGRRCMKAYASARCNIKSSDGFPLRSAETIVLAMRCCCFNWTVLTLCGSMAYSDMVCLESEMIDCTCRDFLALLVGRSGLDSRQMGI